MRQLFYALNPFSNLPNRFIYLLIFCSGVSGLIYEIVWIRQATFVFGSSALALSTVLAVFFMGLGLGSFVFGRSSVNIQQPLLWCVGLELLLALNGLSCQHVFSAADAVYGQVYRRFDPSSNQLLALRAGLVLLILLPPTIIMGGTLPLFCKQLIQDTNKFSAKLSVIYGFNTLGAAFGCVLTGFILLPKLGLTASLQIAVLLNVLVGLGFWRLHKQLPVLQNQPIISSSPSVEGTAQKTPFLLVGLLFFMIGAQALANELIWTRFLAHFVRNSIYSYALALSVVLVGTALGSLWLGPKYDQKTKLTDLFFSFAVLQVISALVIQLLTHLPVVFWQSVNVFGMLPFIILMLPSALIAGASFPLLNRLVAKNPQFAARNVGVLTSLNIVGCIVGSLVTGYLLLPHYGLDVSITSSTACGMIAAGLALLFGVDWRNVQNRPKSFAAISTYSLVLIWLALLVFPPLRIPQDLIAAEEDLIDMVEGYNSNLAVVNRGQEKTLLVDRLWQGIASKNYQIMVAHVPMFHYPDAKDVLVVGLGAGTTASRFLDYGIQHLHIVDIEPRLFEFTRKHFASAWMNDARVSLLPEDGRNYIRHSPQQYDVISVEIGQLDRPGVGVFYTREFYQEVHERLRAGGMVSQFVPLPFLRTNEFASVIKTFMTVFPNAQLWYNTEELLLLGFKGDIRRLSPEIFSNITANPAIKEDININYWGGWKYNLTRFPIFLSGFLASSEQLAALSNIAPTEIYTDDKLQLSYSVFNYKRADQNSLALVPYLQKHLTNMSEAVEINSTDESTLQLATKVRDLNIADIAANDLLSQLHSKPGKAPPSAQKKYEFANRALQWNPQSIDAQVQLQNAQFELHPEQDGNGLSP
jgi:spermidine synthase